MIPGTKAKQRQVLKKLSAVLWQKVGHLVPIELHCLDYTIAQMYNRTVTPRARTTSIPVTPAVEAQIHQVHQADPSLPQQDIDYRVGVNLGRVNETLIGKRA